MLLQVLGEGRLTDALGRTGGLHERDHPADLEPRRARGGGPARLSNPPTEPAAAYTPRRRKFFRPEFFNRLDRVIPFHKLSRGEMKHASPSGS